MDYRHRILEEAAVMFRTYGIRAATMDMLANRMGISKRTIYEVFKDKDELLQGVLKWMVNRQHEVMKKILNESENVIEAIFKMLDLMRNHFQNMSPAFLLDMKRYRKEILKKLAEKNELPYAENNTELLERGIREGIFRNDINIEITNKCLFEVARIANDKEVFPPELFGSKNVMRHLYINYLRGISTQAGLDLINQYDKK